ncbi:membrane protein [Paenibacillus terrigena]|uniref:COG4705 family protein n=1 Tax=Paenibacillus terrigena TaxID=369333 RepID=UPI000377D297|nr:membrane protein [Paenibacillus terrigena]
MDQSISQINKIPQLTLLFWIMKIAATTLGETGSDLVTIPGSDDNYLIPFLFFIGVFVVFLTIQLFVKKYVPVVYWVVITATSLAGTAFSDYMDRSLGLGYMKGSAILLSLLIIIFVFWYFTEPSLNVKHIATKRVEVLYWIAILVSNTLGTAAGDFLSHKAEGVGKLAGGGSFLEEGLGLTIAQGAMITGGLILLVLLAYWFSNINRVVLFWLAFILTRPFGATFGDYLIKPHEKGGLGLENGTVIASAILLGILVVCIIIQYAAQKKTGNASDLMDKDLAS